MPRTGTLTARSVSAPGVVPASKRARIVAGAGLRGASLRLFTDGSCLGNPGPGGWAFCVEREGILTGTERGGGVPMTTNNVMELRAAWEGVEWALKEAQGEALEVVTDSAYLIGGVKPNGWIEAWKRNGWQTSSRKEVKNRDHWERLDRARTSHGNVSFAWVKAHNGNVGNERADTLALEMATRAQRGDPRPVHVVDGKADARGGTEVESDVREAESVARERVEGVTGLRHFVNLTNGIELLPWMRQAGLPEPIFMRLESTACEQQRFAHILDSLDASLVMSLALGEACVVYDCGSRNAKRGVPRALWYGTEFVKYALHCLWFPEQRDRRPGAVLRGYNVAAQWDKVLGDLPEGTKKRIRYYAPYARRCNPSGLLLLFGAYRATDQDNNAEFYVETLARDAEGTGGGSTVRGTVYRGVEQLQRMLASGGLLLWESGSTYSAEWHSRRESEGDDDEEDIVEGLST